ncbi:uncharacterized protein A1O9_12947, partial [Exophiala aquamarina CBS 119918]
MSGYDTIPSASKLKVEMFTLSIPEQALNDFKDLLRLSNLAPKTYENLHTDDGNFGVSHEWMTNAKNYWLTKYDWRATEKYNNSFPNFIAQVPDDDGEIFRIHFVALFSRKENAVPILYMHGWPGSHLEHLKLFDLYRKKYTPEDLPYHVIAVSLPGWTLSSGPPLDENFTLADIARIMNKLMVGLGFGSGYICQGGDIGSLAAKVIAGTYDECKDNFIAAMVTPKIEADSGLPPDEKRAWESRGLVFRSTGRAYGLLHATRPATIGFVLSSSPLAQLAWVGEKFIEWSDETPPLKDILDSVTLYWFTKTLPRSIYCYREFAVPGGQFPHGDPKYLNSKPVAYSWFPKEVAPMPRAWVEAQGLNLVLFKKHEV